MSNSLLKPPVKEDLEMARTDVKDVADSVKQAGAALGQTTRDLTRDLMDTAVERGRDAQQVGRKRAKKLQKQASKQAAELQQQASKQAKKSTKKARKRANKKAQEWVDLAAEKTGRKPKHRKTRVLAVLGGGALAAFAVITVRKKQAEQNSAYEPGAPSAR